MTTVAGVSEHGQYSSPGRVRDHNEDAVLAEPDLGLWIVADGMGGHEAGEVASAMVVDHIAARVRDGAGLDSAILDAQQELKRAVERGDGPEGMGTTVVVAQIRGDRYEIAWVGDSRAYIWHDGHLRQLTHDHSYVQQLVDEGAISQDEAERHPERSTLSRCLGGGIDDELVVDKVAGTLFAGERLILCTDGVNSELEDEQIAVCLDDALDASAADAARHLVEAAVAAGGHDNATAIVITAGPNAPTRIQQTAPRPAVRTGRDSHVRSRKVALVAMVLVPAFIALAAVVYFLGNNSHHQPAGQRFNGPAGSSVAPPPDEDSELWRSGFEKKKKGVSNETALHRG